MPLRRVLEGRNFGPKAAAVLVEAFNEIIDELDLRTIADRERAARSSSALLRARRSSMLRSSATKLWA